MNLLGVRQQFIKLSGRYDLATTTSVDHDTDNGADFFINAGMRFLDRKYLTNKTKGSIFEELVAGDWYLTFKNCRAIEEVWCNDTEARWQLTRYLYKTIKKNYTGLVSATDGGVPLYYSPIWIRSTDATDYGSLGTFFNYVKADDDGSYNGIIFTPKADEAYNIEVVGRFSNVDLSTNTDSNYWTLMLPDALLKSALYQLETFNRNSEGAKDWLAAIEVEMQSVEFDKVREESNEARVME